MVEHTAVNRGVVGSSPTRGVQKPVNILFAGFFVYMGRGKSFALLDLFWSTTHHPKAVGFHL